MYLLWRYLLADFFNKQKNEARRRRTPKIQKTTTTHALLMQNIYTYTFIQCMGKCACVYVAAPKNRQRPRQQQQHSEFMFCLLLLLLLSLAGSLSLCLSLFFTSSVLLYDANLISSTRSTHTHTHSEFTLLI